MGSVFLQEDCFEEIFSLVEHLQTALEGSDFDQVSSLEVKAGVVPISGGLLEVDG